MKILHLYYDIMNLYGDYANVRAMERMMLKNGIECSVDRLSFNDKAVLSDYDFIYIGSGTERNRNVVCEDMKKYRDELKDCIDSGKVILMTGNSFEMLGKSITGAGGDAAEGLGIFEFTVSEQKKTRNTADAVFTADFLDRELVGFINKCSEIEGIDKPLPTLTTGNHAYLCTPVLIGQQSGSAARPADDPVPTIATKGAIQVATPVILDMSRPGGPDSGHVKSADEPMCTITTCDAMQTLLPMLEDGRLVDIRIRMLKPSELAAAHSFPKEYVLTGNRGEQVKQIGNSVPVMTAEALCEQMLKKYAE